MGTKERLDILIEKYKSYFPEDIEAIVMTEEDYERQFGNTFETITKETVINELLKRIDKAIEYIENHRIGNEYSYEYDLFQRNARTSDLLSILKGEDKE